MNECDRDRAIVERDADKSYLVSCEGSTRPHIEH